MKMKLEKLLDQLRGIAESFYEDGSDNNWEIFYVSYRTLFDIQQLLRTNISNHPLLKDNSCNIQLTSYSIQIHDGNFMFYFIPLYGLESDMFFKISRFLSVEEKE